MYTALLGDAASWVSSVDFSGLTSTVEAVIPIALPIIVAFLGIRKGISFMMGLVRGA